MENKGEMESFDVKSRQKCNSNLSVKVYLKYRFDMVKWNYIEF